MKRILALVLTVSCMLSLYGCGDSKGVDASNVSDVPGAGNTENAPGNENDQTEENNAGDAAYKTYDDFVTTERVAAYDIYFDVPEYSETQGYGFATHASQDYSIIVASSREAQPGLSAEDDMADVMNDTFHWIVNRFNDYKCEDYTPDVIETVTLTCGAEAVKFEGIQPADCWGTPKECYVYGYSFVFNDVLLIASYIVFNDEEVDDAKRAELADYVDRMVQTVRTVREA